MTTRFVCGLFVFACMSFVPARALAQDVPASPERSFVQTLKDDLKSVVSKESIPLLFSATALALLASPFDESLTYSASCSTFLATSFNGWARIAGQEWLLASSALTTYAVGRVLDRPKVAAVGGDLTEALLVSAIVSLPLKVVVSRTRPDGYPHSFPSGHAAGTFAAATVMQRHFGWKGGIPAYTTAALISGARLQANSHYPTDIILGAAIGILSGRAATFDLGKRNLSLSPGVTRDGSFIINGTIH